MSEGVSSAKVRARQNNGVFALIAECRIERDEIACNLDGEIIRYPTRYSIQVGEFEHLEPFNDQEDVRSAIRFLNHSCDPSAYISCKDRTVRALRDIEKGEEITFNYNTTEYEMFRPFRCECGASRCRGVVRGFKYLSPRERMSVASALAPHLRQWIAPLLRSENLSASNKHRAG